MKINISLRRQTVGYALTVVFVFCAIAVIILAATVKRTSTTAMLNERQNQFNRTYFAAQAGVEKAVGLMLADYKQGQDALVANNVTNYSTSVPTNSESSYWANYQFSDGQGNLGKTYVKLIISGKNNWVTDQADGLSRWRTIYRVVSDAKELGSRFTITNASQQDMALDAIPVFQFAIFYNTNDLEFTWAAPLVVNGRVHANGSVYTGVASSSSLTFNSLISATGVIMKKALAGYTVSQMTGSETYTGGQKTNNITLSLPIGTNSSREIINIPPAGEDVDSVLGTNRYYNKASMVLLVSNTTVTAIIKSSADDPSPTNLVYTFSGANTANVTTNLTFLSLTNKFYDQREGTTNTVTQIDMGKLTTWASNSVAVQNKRPSASNPFDLLYVADSRTASAHQLDVVRLTNAKTLPSFGSGSGLGFTVATPDPLYTVGNYNVPDAYAGTTNTSQSVPASLVSDAWTILSAQWDDSKSYGAYTSRNNPSSVTINAAVITGIVPSTGTTSSTFSGGVMNLPRLLEPWDSGSDTITLNTSIVNLYSSAFATHQFVLPGTYYSAPSRQFSFDQNLTNPSKQPPGAPSICEIIRYQWATPPPDSVTYSP